MPNKICRVYQVDGESVRADGLPIDPLHVYIYEDPDKPGSGECWLFDAPMPDSIAEV